MVGLVTGFVGPLVAPWAQTRAEQSAGTRARRQQLVADGRQLVTEAITGRWWHEQVGVDARFLALRRHLSPKTLEIYVHGEYLLPSEGDLTDEGMIDGHNELLGDLDRLEVMWKLV